MAQKIKVVAYFDGSNFYHSSRGNYGITKINFFNMCNQLLDLSEEKIVRIKYFNSPLRQQENPKAYSDQLRFYSNLEKTPFVEIDLGKLVKRPLNKIHVNCADCDHQEAEHLLCPICKKEIHMKDCSKYIEKGVDVKLAINMLLDALEDRYDVALLFSNDADFCPAIKYIIGVLKKKVIYCHFPKSKTNELAQICSGSRLITKEMVENSRVF